MKTRIIENTWLRFTATGWGNGYVIIPKGHHLHGKPYDDISVNVHGGLTFSELVDEDLRKRFKLSQSDIGSWCVGFDTAHSGDTPANWPKERVKRETVDLKKQLQSLVQPLNQ